MHRRFNSGEGALGFHSSYFDRLIWHSCVCVCVMIFGWFAVFGSLDRMITCTTFDSLLFFLLTEIRLKEALISVDQKKNNKDYRRQG